MKENSLGYKYALLIIVMIFSCTACTALIPFTKANKLDKAKMVAQGLTMWYTDVYAEVQKVYSVADAEKKESMKANINPAMNTLKKVIRTYIVSLQLIEKGASPVVSSDKYLMEVADAMVDVQSSLKSLGINFPEFFASK